MSRNLKSLLWTALVCTIAVPSLVSAKEDKYPAADFKPEVIYQNSDLIGSSASTSPSSVRETSTPDPKYPAAHFTPVILQQAAITEATHAPDPKYPAAYFTPVVIYPPK